MKELLKVLAVLAVLAGVIIAVAAYLQAKEEPDYISIYGDSDDEEA